MANESLDKVQALLSDLLDAAKKGAIIPVRLPKEIEQIIEAVEAAKKEAAAPSSSGSSETFNKEEFLKEQAYFFGHAIHELRTPMTSVRGYSDMLSNAAMGPLTDMQKQFVETIRSNSRRMESLMQDVADMNKLRAGTLKVTEKMDMFKNIALMAEKAVQPLAEQQGVTLTFEVEAGLPILNTDGELLAKALTKLLENAIRYQKPDADEKVVTLKAHGEGKNLIIEISDKGIGIAPEDQAQLGKIYFRSENELVRTFKGSGLGIPVAYGIIRLLGGTVELKSTLGEGTTVTVTMVGMS
ncbi:HAMP domain-containing histidine kinase [Anaerolineae bacterium CFX9]|jgi:signal transduction histidine kinase|nr:HAMP domain-containing histidine kinase [Anaerolineae bacterium CFX9]